LHVLLLICLFITVNPAENSTGTLIMCCISFCIINFACSFLHSFLFLQVIE
jgi:hypothetical protein